MQGKVLWFTQSPEDIEQATQLGIPIIKNLDSEQFVLYRDGDTLKLQAPSEKKWKPVWADFEDPLLLKQLSKRGKKDILARAVAGTKKDILKIYDATMGFGMDGFFLSLLGHHVISIEKLSWLYALVSDGLRRYNAGEKYFGDLNWSLIYGDSLDDSNFISAKTLLGGSIDVILCDPLFDPKRGSSPKEMQLLHALSGDDESGHESLTSGVKFLESIFKKNPAKVVVKRPIHGKPLNESVAYTLEGRTIRYDIYRQ